MAYYLIFVMRVHKFIIKDSFSVKEIQQLTIILIKLAQLESFPEEIRTRSVGKLRA